MLKYLSQIHQRYIDKLTQTRIPQNEKNLLHFCIMYALCMHTFHLKDFFLTGQFVRDLGHIIHIYKL